MAEKKVKLVIDAWPKLIEELSELNMLGTSPEDIARFLIIEGVEDRRQGRAAYARFRAAAIAGGWRGNI